MHVYGPYTRTDGRQIVIVVENNGVRRTVSYPKWLLETQLGRRLDPDKETVDHIDGDFNNNDFSNLRIVPRDEHSADDTRRSKNLKFNCAWCGADFERSPRLVRDKSKKNKAGPFCNKSCAGKYSRMLQLKLIEKLGPQPFPASEYYKKKNVTASADDFDVDIHFSDLILFAQASLKSDLMALRSTMATEAQKVIDAWEQDENGEDVELGFGGACDLVQRALSDVISQLDVNMTDGGQPGDDHAYLIVYDDNEAYVVDIPADVYETGGGYSWRKRPNVVISPDDVIIEKIDRNLIEDSDLDY